MKRGFGKYLLGVQILVYMCIATAFEGGSGTSGDPYQIATCEQLQNISSDTSAYYELVQSVDCSATNPSVGGSMWGAEGFEPISSFSGRLDGHKYAIRDFFINRSSNDQALFATSSTAALIANLRMENVFVSGANNIGALGGRSFGAGVFNVSVRGDIRGTGRTGGIVGQFQDATVDQVAFIGTVIGGSSNSNEIGGIVGRTSSNTNIGTAFVQGEIGGQGCIGGILGDSSTVVSTFSEMYSAVVISGTGNGLGAIVGCVSASGDTFTNVYWDNEITAFDWRGSGSSGSPENVTGFNTADIQGESAETNLVGFDFAEVWRTITIPEDDYPVFFWQAGDLEVVTGVVEDSFSGDPVVGANVTAVPDDSSFGTVSVLTNATGGYTITLPSVPEYTFTVTGTVTDNSDGFTFTGGDQKIVNVVPDMQLNFSLGPFFTGAGTSGSPYLISDVHELQTMRYNLSAHYRIQQDIDASETVTWFSGAGFEPIGSNAEPFAGTLNGGGFSITGLVITRTAQPYIGLLGYTDGATVTNVTVYDGNVQGDDVVGSLIGQAENSVVSYSHTTGNVSGSTTVGGLIGRLVDSEVIDSYTFNAVTATGSSVGGLVGHSEDSIINRTYSKGAVVGVGNVGGLIGNAVGSIIDRSFWDSDTSNQESSDGGDGMSTEDMLLLFTYLTANWNFDDIWGINSSLNEGYPFLRFQGFESDLASAVLQSAIYYHAPTPASGNVTQNQSLILSATISDSLLSSLIYSWDAHTTALYDDTLVLMYNFDNRSSLGENSSFVRDVSLEQNDGFCTGADCPLWVSAGRYDGAFYFDGTTHLKTPYNPEYAPGDGFTYSAWFKTNVTQNSVSFFSARDQAKTNDPLAEFWIRTNSIEGLFRGATGSRMNLVHTVSYADDAWNHIAAVIDDGTGYLYYNGQLVATETGLDMNIDLSDVYLTVGASNYENSIIQHYTGYVDELRVWHRALTTDEIYTVYASNLARLNSYNWSFVMHQRKNATADLDDGVYEYYVRAQNPYHLATQSERNVTIDTTAPTITITSPEPQQYNTTTITLDVSADESIASWYYSINGSTNVSFTPGDTISLNDGTYEIILYAIDLAGNVGSNSVIVEMNGEAPAITIHSPANGGSYTSSAVPVHVSSNKEILAWWYSLDNGATNVSFDPNETLTLDEGTYILHIFGDGANGYEGNATVSFTRQNPRQGGGGGGGGIGQTYQISSVDISQGYGRGLLVNERYSFEALHSYTSQFERHSLQLIRFDDDTAFIIIRSLPHYLDLLKGVPTYVDLDADGVYDIFVRYDGRASDTRRAVIYIQQLEDVEDSVVVPPLPAPESAQDEQHIAVPPTQEVPPETVLENTTRSPVTGSVVSEGGAGKAWMLGIILIIAVLLAGYIFFRRKKRRDSFY